MRIRKKTKRSILSGRWYSMMNRCYDSSNHKYTSYGKKNIKVCDLWHTFDNYAEFWISHGFDPALTIDRIDSSKGYCPENVRLIGFMENSTLGGMSIAKKVIDSNGKIYKSIHEAGRSLGLPYQSIQQSIKKGLLARDVRFKYF